MRLLLTLIACGIAVSAHAKDLGTVGATYPIAEKDALTEIEDRAKTVDWKGVFSQVKPDKFRPENLVTLPKAEKDRSFEVDMTYTLDMDIPDGRGGVLYPKGYTFNPLDYMPFRKTLVIIDGDDPDQVEWFIKSEYRSKVDVMLLLTGGGFSELAKKTNRPVFYATAPIVNRFVLQAVPSIVRQKERFMEVREVLVKRHGKSKGEQ